MRCGRRWLRMCDGHKQDGDRRWMVTGWGRMVIGWRWMVMDGHKMETEQADLGRLNFAGNFAGKNPQKGRGLCI